MKAVTRAAEEPRPVLWASWSRTPKLLKDFWLVGVAVVAVAAAVPVEEGEWE